MLNKVSYDLLNFKVINEVIYIMLVTIQLHQGSCEYPVICIPLLSFSGCNPSSPCSYNLDIIVSVLKACFMKNSIYCQLKDLNKPSLLGKIYGDWSWYLRFIPFAYVYFNVLYTSHHLVTYFTEKRGHILLAYCGRWWISKFLSFFSSAKNVNWLLNYIIHLTYASFLYIFFIFCALLF